MWTEIVARVSPNCENTAAKSSISSSEQDLAIIQAIDEIKVTNSQEFIKSPEAFLPVYVQM